MNFGFPTFSKTNKLVNGIAMEKLCTVSFSIFHKVTLALLAASPNIPPQSEAKAERLRQAMGWKGWKG